MLTMTPLGGLRGLGDACSDQCVEQASSVLDPQLQTCIANCPTPAQSSAAFGACMDACWPLPAGDAYNTCAEKCGAADWGGRYGDFGATATTVTKTPTGTIINNPSNVPSDAALPLCSAVAPGTSCFQPAPATNWWVIGGLAALGVLSAFGIVVAYRRATHAA